MSDMQAAEEWRLFVGCNVWWRDTARVACGSANCRNRKTGR